MTQLNLFPPLIDRGKVENFGKSRRTLLVSVSPMDNTVGVHAGPVRFLVTDRECKMHS